MENIKVTQTKEGTNNLIDAKINEDNNANSSDNIFDVAIIGGGYAGLSAALLLGRYLRTTIIFDVVKPRKSHIHGYLGFEKSPIEDVIQKAWKDVLQYDSVKRIVEKVEKVEKDSDNDLFLITTTKSLKISNQGSDISRKRIAKSRYLIIATGIQHQIPNIKNFEEYQGNGVWHCPHCDGFEATDKSLVIIASDNTNNKAIDYAKVFLGWTKDITLFFQRPRQENNNDIRKYPLLTDEQRQEAATLGINVVENDEIAEIIADSKINVIKGVLSKGNRFYKAEVLFYHIGQIIQNEIANQLGCEFDEGYVMVNKKQQTTVPNVYAAGDIDTDRHYAILAAASGALAAISIYEELLKYAIKVTKIKSED
jgi:thioredoxin reductase